MSNSAQRQATYRRRRREMVDEILTMRGLPSIPAVSTIPGWPRWKEAMTRIAAQIENIETEMQEYYDARSERWQESDAADRFYERLGELRVILESAQAWPEG